MVLKTVLLGDDKRSNRAVYAAGLKYRGYVILDADDGQEGLRLSSDDGPISSDLATRNSMGGPFIRRLKDDMETRVSATCSRNMRVRRRPARRSSVRIRTRIGFQRTIHHATLERMDPSPRYHGNNIRWCRFQREEIVMEDEQDARLVSFLSGFLCGAAIGAGVGLLIAPGSGRRTRRHLRGAADDLRETTYERWDELTDEVKERLEQTLKGARRGVTRMPRWR